MLTLRSALLAASLAASVLAAPAPLPTPAPDLSKAKGKRATSCTFSGSNGYSLASESQAECATIVLSALTVPSGVTLDLSKLEDDTTVSGKCYFYTYEIIHGGLICNIRSFSRARPPGNTLSGLARCSKLKVTASPSKVPRVPSSMATAKNTGMAKAALAA